jgi:hypothetical protein
MRVRVVSPCRANEPVAFVYGALTQRFKLSNSGALEMLLPLFAGKAVVPRVELKDGSQHTLPALADETTPTAMIALVWKRPVDLNLHVFENSAPLSERGHVTRQRAGSGAGRIEALDANGAEGDRIEVYTVGATAQLTLSVAVDYATRGSVPTPVTCEGGQHARVPFEVFYRRPDGSVQRTAAAFAPAPCGVAIPPEVRFNRDVLPALSISP